MTEQTTPTLDDMEFHILEQDHKSAGSGYRAALKQVHLTAARITAAGTLHAFPTARFIEFTEGDQHIDTLRPMAILDTNREEIDDNGGHGGVQIFADDMCDELYSYAFDLPYEKPLTVTFVDGKLTEGAEDPDYDWFLVEDDGRSKLLDIAAVLDQYRASR